MNNGTVFSYLKMKLLLAFWVYGQQKEFIATGGYQKLVYYVQLILNNAGLYSRADTSTEVERGGNRVI